MSAAPLRRSARKKAKYSNESGTDTKAPNERVREKEKPMAQRPGKTKTAHVTGRRSGKLACMSDMPLDVLFEVSVFEFLLVFKESFFELVFIPR